MSSLVTRHAATVDPWDADTVPAHHVPERHDPPAPAGDGAHAEDAGSMFAGLYDAAPASLLGTIKGFFGKGEEKVKDTAEEHVEGPRQLAEDVRDGVREWPHVNGQDLKDAGKGLGKLNKDEVNDIGESIDRLSQNVKTGGELTKHVGESMEGVCHALDKVKDTLDIAALVLKLYAATGKWSAAFDAFQKNPTRTNGDLLKQATDAWCGLVKPITGKAPPVVSHMLGILIDSVKVGVNAAVDVRVGAEGRNAARVEESEDRGPQKPTDVLSAADREVLGKMNVREGGDLGQAGSYGTEFEYELKEMQRKGVFVSPQAIESCREQIQAWAKLEGEVAQLRKPALGFIPRDLKPLRGVKSFTHEPEIEGADKSIDKAKRDLAATIRDNGMGITAPR